MDSHATVSQGLPGRQLHLITSSFASDTIYFKLLDLAHGPFGEGSLFRLRHFASWIFSVQKDFFIMGGFWLWLSLSPFLVLSNKTSRREKKLYTPKRALENLLASLLLFPFYFHLQLRKEMLFRYDLYDCMIYDGYLSSYVCLLLHILSHLLLILLWGQTGQTFWMGFE